MTIKLFWEDPSLCQCKAVITSLKNTKVKLDRTVFFAFSGGQASDEGTIGGIKVVEAIKLGDKESIIDIEYTLEKALTFKVGDEVEVLIDKERREKLRKLHSAAHIAYYFITNKLGKLKIIGSNITPEKARVDFLYDLPLTEALTQIESEVNKFLAEEHEIVTKGDEKNLDLRWWSCEQWKMPCGGTHVKSTKEIGQLFLKRKNLGTGKERVEICLK